jgi:hydroxymethylglutaryl-CoA lyase
LAIIANTQGAVAAAAHSEIEYLGFPFSISENFQMRNTHKTIAESLISLQEIQNNALKSNKTVIAYLSMGFGNPYGDAWNVEIVAKWVEKLSSMGIEIISLSDTIGTSTPEVISYLFSNLIPKYPNIVFGAHLHTTPNQWLEKIEAAYQSGCRRFDGALLGYGGCPMATNHLTGNMPTEKMLDFFKSKNEVLNIDFDAFKKSLNHASKIFNSVVK